MNTFKEISELLRTTDTDPEILKKLQNQFYDLARKSGIKQGTLSVVLNNSEWTFLRSAWLSKVLQDLEFSFVIYNIPEDLKHYDVGNDEDRELVKNIPKYVLRDIIKWLGNDGLEFFRDLEEKYDGNVSPVYMDGDLPHPVHLREGMQFRNFIRSMDYFIDWDQHMLDNNWSLIVKRILCEEKDRIL